MYIIYYGTGTSLSGSLAAFIHLSNSPSPTSLQQQLVHEIDELWYLEKKSMGHLHYVGTDPWNHEVFLLNVGQAETIVLPAFKSVFEILQLRPNQYLLVDTTSFTNIYTHLGFHLYRLAIFRKLAHTLLRSGINKNLNKIFSVVEATKNRLKKDS